MAGPPCAFPTPAPMQVLLWLTAPFATCVSSSRCSLALQVQGLPDDLLLTMDDLQCDWHLRMQGLCAGKCLQIGLFPINLVSLRAIAKREDLELGLHYSDMKPKDKQNQAAAMRLFDLQVSGNGPWQPTMRSSCSQSQPCKMLAAHCVRLYTILPEQARPYQDAIQPKLPCALLALSRRQAVELCGSQPVLVACLCSRFLWPVSHLPPIQSSQAPLPAGQIPKARAAACNPGGGAHKSAYTYALTIGKYCQWYATHLFSGSPCAGRPLKQDKLQVLPASIQCKNSGKK